MQLCNAILAMFIISRHLLVTLQRLFTIFIVVLFLASVLVIVVGRHDDVTLDERLLSTKVQPFFVDVFFHFSASKSFLCEKLVVLRLLSLEVVRGLLSGGTTTIAR